MRSSSMYLSLVAFLCYVVHGFSSVSPKVTTSVKHQQVIINSRSSLLSNNRNIKLDCNIMQRRQHQHQHQQQQQNIVSSVYRGGGSSSTTNIKSSSSPINTDTKCPATTFATVLASLYGSGGVIYILVKAIKRVLPIALEPFQGSVQPLSTIQLGAYIFTCIWFAYVEGYKGFQQKFSPLVVKRSFTLIPGKNNTKWYHYIFAPFYSMGLIHATKKRLIVSWCVSIGVAVVVAAVKKLPYPYRNIIDAGVVAGLSWGSISILLLYIKSWITGTPPAGDANLPQSK